MDSFFGIGIFELVLIAIIALVVMGPDRLPSAMREMAKYMRQLREISGEFQSQFSEELKMLDELNPKRIINDAITPPPTKPTTARPAVTKPTQQPLKPVVPTAKPASAAEPSKPATSTETENSILPPKPADAGSAGVAQNGVNSQVAPPPPVATPATTGDNSAPASAIPDNSAAEAAQ